MAEMLKITKGQPFVVYVPLVQLNTDGEVAIDATALTDISVQLACACGTTISVVPSTYENYLVLELSNDLAVGVYNLNIVATTGDGQQFSLRQKNAIEIVEWDKDSNWQDYIIGEHIELTDQLFIAGTFLTDEEYTALKQELQEAIAAAEQAEADADAAKETLTNAATALGNLPTLLISQQTTIENQQTLISELSGGIVMMTEDEYEPALEELATNFV